MIAMLKEYYTLSPSVYNKFVAKHSYNGNGAFKFSFYGLSFLFTDRQYKRYIQDQLKKSIYDGSPYTDDLKSLLAYVKKSNIKIYK